MVRPVYRHARCWRRPKRWIHCGMHKKLMAGVAAATSHWMVLVAALTGHASESRTEWTWQNSYAEVDPKGDLRWKPHPFVFEKGDSVRYIDFDGGKDSNSGETQSSAWKHHPWDPNATGQSAADSVADTYV